MAQRKLKSEGMIVVTLDTTNPDWTNQEALVAGAMQQVIEAELGQQWVIKRKAAKRAGASKASNIIQLLANTEGSEIGGVNETFENQAIQSDLNLFLLQQDYVKALLNNKIAALRGGSFSPSVYEVDHTVNKGVSVQAPGLVRTGKPGGANEDLIFIPDGNSYNVVLGQDLANGEIAGAVYTHTPNAEPPGGSPSVTDFFFELAGIADGAGEVQEMQGVWNIDVTDTMSGDGQPDIVYRSIANSATGTFVVTKDAAGVTETRVLLNGGFYNQPHKISMQNLFFDFADEAASGYVTRARHTTNLGSNFFSGYLDRYTDAPDNYTSIVRTSSELSITNDTGATLSAGTVLCKLNILAGLG